MSFISAFLNKTAKLYTIDTTTSTETGSPIENLVFIKDIRVFFSANPRQVYQVFDPGQLRTGQFVAISSEATETFNVLEIDEKKYRITAANPAQLKNRIFAYINYLEYYQH